MIDYQAKQFEYVRPAELSEPNPQVHPVVIVGAGPVGLSLAIDLAQRGQKVLVLDNDNRLSTGSRAICFAKKTLEIFDRLGIGDQVAAKGVSWSKGKVFYKDKLSYEFDLLPQENHRQPAFYNIQQYYIEGFLAERAAQLPNIQIRWLNQVEEVIQPEALPTLADSSSVDHVIQLKVKTPDGTYNLPARFVIACDGSRSQVRKSLGLESKGRVFHDRFLIADITMSADFPTERWFWFDPPFHPNQSVLLHKQPDGQWRVDFQLGWDADPEVEKQPENIRPRVQALLGKDIQFDITWASVYTFACLRMDRFSHGRVIFMGDAAHGVSPFGARGANSGIQDAENFAWKLDLVLKGVASERLLDTYCVEREAAADENIMHSSRATDFITPKSALSRLFRDATLELAQEYEFARKLVNSGRLSTASSYRGESASNTEASAVWIGGPPIGAPAPDAKVFLSEKAHQASWLLSSLSSGFNVLVFSADLSYPWHEALREQCQALCQKGLLIQVLFFDRRPAHEHLWTRYGVSKGGAYLLRPDCHVLARWTMDEAPALLSSIQACIGETLHA